MATLPPPSISSRFPKSPTPATISAGSLTSREGVRANSVQTRNENTAAKVLAYLLFASLLFTVGCGGSGNTVITGKHPATYTYSVLHSFTGQPDAMNPYGGLVLDGTGNLYGATPGGGASNWGAVFKIDPLGNEIVFYNFTNGPDGRGPLTYGRLVRDPAGNFYGTTAGGGGTVFELDPTGIETTLYYFSGSDGLYPTDGVVRDPVGNIYGTTGIGGLFNTACSDYHHILYGCGVVFKLDPSGTETTLHAFTGGSDGAAPYGDLIRDAAGNLYGVTFDSYSIPGVLFKIDATGTYSVLHTFAGGGYASGGLILDAAGNLYGTAGATVFKMDSTGNQTVLYSFTGGADGLGPTGDLVMDTAGNLYGATSGGGASGNGVVFRLDSSGKETVLYSFTGAADGASPNAGLAMDAAGDLYGTANTGGVAASGCSASGCGVVFKLTLVP